VCVCVSVCLCMCVCVCMYKIPHHEYTDRFHHIYAMYAADI